jgi:hypothetical protein
MFGWLRSSERGPGSPAIDIGYELDHEAARVTEGAPKAWRWIGEMAESAKAMRELGLPAGFSEAAAMTYQRIAEQP